MRWFPVLLLVGAGLSELLAAPAIGAPVQLQITKWEINTVHNHKREVRSGATVKFCASDPYYGVSPYFTWSGVPFGQVMTLTVSQPRLKATTSRAKTFEATGKNADTMSAAAYGVSATSLPSGKYAFSVAVGGVKANGSITLIETKHC